MYAVVEIQGHQYIVKQWDEIVVDKVEWKKWTKVDIENVLLVFDEKWEKVSVGKPHVAKAKVVVEIVDTYKWKKINVLKFKKKNRYERNFGFRPHQTTLLIKKIDFNG